MKDTIKTFSTPYGELAIDTVADAKMAAVFGRGEYHQQDTVELLSELITGESIFVDGGAHIGTITIPLARRAGRTISYEADAYTCSILRQNVDRNGVTVDIREKGIGATAGRGEMLSVREGNAGAHSLSVGVGGVKVVTLDEDLETFDVLKLDVEGMELSVLRGAERIIREARPTILFEVNLSQLRAHHAPLYSLDFFFRTRDYYFYLPFRFDGALVLGETSSLSLVALCMYPGAYFFNRTSSVFDILAVPKGSPIPLPVLPMWRTMQYVLGGNLREKIRRIRKYFI